MPLTSASRLHALCRLLLVLILPACVGHRSGGGRLIGPLTSDSIVMAEFKDNGRAVETRQVAALLEHVDSMVLRAAAGSGRPVVVLTYTHGWNNDADTSRGDFTRFRALVQRMRRERDENCQAEAQQCAVLVPIYLAWRGRSIAIGNRPFTFWSRKSVAEAIGRGEYAALLAQLSARRLEWGRDPRKRGNVLIHAGHSFGAAALLSAGLPGLVRGIVSAGDESGIPADLVVAVNPAIEAAALDRTVLSTLVRQQDETRRLDRVSKSADASIPPDALATPLRLAVIDSDADKARRLLFPLGRAVAAGPVAIASRLLLTGALLSTDGAWRATAIVPGVALVNSLGDALPEQSEQRAAGVPSAQLTHRAVIVTGASSGSAVRRRIPLDGGRTIEVRPLKGDGDEGCQRSVMVLRVGRDLIGSHGDIWGTEHQALVAALVQREVRRHAAAMR